LDAEFNQAAGLVALEESWYFYFEKFKGLVRPSRAVLVDRRGTTVKTNLFLEVVFELVVRLVFTEAPF